MKFNKINGVKLTRIILLTDAIFLIAIDNWFQIALDNPWSFGPATPSAAMPTPANSNSLRPEIALTARASPEIAQLADYSVCLPELLL